MTSRIILRYVSDLHLEFYSDLLINYSISKLKPIWNFEYENNTIFNLALLGDIGNPYNPSLEQFLQLISNKYSNIFYIPGNHEYYNLSNDNSYTMVKVKNKLDYICSQYPNIHLMDNESIELYGINFIGTTLWSHIPNEKKLTLSKIINDFNLIMIDNNKTLTPNDTNKLNKQNIIWLKEQLIKSIHLPNIIMSHHAPLFNNQKHLHYLSNPKYINSYNNEAFHNNLSHLITKPIVAWLYGHTHYSSEFKLNNVIIGTNQLGYLNEQKKINFNPHKFIDLSDILINNI